MLSWLGRRYLCLLPRNCSAKTMTTAITAAVAANRVASFSPPMAGSSTWPLVGVTRGDVAQHGIVSEGPKRFCPTFCRIRRKS